MSVNDTLKRLGIEITTPTPPVGAFVPAVRVGDLWFLSGHIAKRGDGSWRGRLGGDMTTGQGQEAARAATIDMLGTLQATVGDLDQVPPMVSAIHHEGRRLHELAREGREVERAPRRVHVARFEVAEAGALSWSFRVECSAGTYVRSIVDDLGRALGGGAHLTSLRRTGIGRFSVDDATALESIRDGSRAPGELLVAPRAMVEHLGVLTLSSDDAAVLARGGVVHVEAGRVGEVAAVDEAGALVAVGVLDGTGALRPEVVIASGTPRDGH